MGSSWRKRTRRADLLTDISSHIRLVSVTISSVRMIQKFMNVLAEKVTDPNLMRFRATQGITPSLFVTKPAIEAFDFPLLFEPGDAWEYSVGIDWAGWMVERVTNSTLEEYFQKNIFSPLGIKSMTFHPKNNPAISSKMTDMSIREGGVKMFGNPANPDGKVVYTDDPLFNPEMPDCTGGAGLYGNLTDYFKVLHSLLQDDEKLLKKTTVNAMFQPQLNPAGLQTFENILAIPDVSVQMNDLPQGTKVDYGLGAGLIKSDIPGRWRAGTLYWSGYANLNWYIDRNSGIAGIIGSQLHTPGDPKFVEFARLWGEEIFRKGGKEKL